MRNIFTDASDRSIRFVSDRFSGSTVLRTLSLSDLRLVLRAWFAHAINACHNRLNGFMTGGPGLSLAVDTPEAYPVTVQWTGNKPSLGKDQAARIRLMDR